MQSPPQPIAQTCDEDDNSLTGEDIEVRHYVQREEDIGQHKLWRRNGFWDEALMVWLRDNMEVMEPVQWDELPADALRERVLGDSWTCMQHFLEIAVIHYLLGSSPQYHIRTAKLLGLHYESNGDA